MWQILLITLLVLLLIDWYQTEQIARHPDLFYETNKILGVHPSRREVTLYFLAIILATIALALKLPHQWALVAMSVGILTEGYYVISNYKLGIR